MSHPAFQFNMKDGKTVDTFLTPLEQRPPRKKLKQRWRFPKIPFVIACVCLLGTGTLLYPSTAMWFAAKEQANEVDGYLSEVTTVAPEKRADALTAATDYNHYLTGGSTSIAAGERLPLAEHSTSDLGYAEQLQADDHGTMARIKIPSIDVDLPIYHGTTDAVLEKGVGHLEGSALPVGGQGTHAVLTGHRGLASAELFTRLNEVHKGQRFTIEVFGEVLTYQVSSAEVVEPDQTQTLYPTAKGDQITLVTCTPLGINSHRILVTGQRILPTPPEDIAEAGKSNDTAGFPWWAVVGSSAVVILIGYVWWAGGRFRRGALSSKGSENDRSVQND
ncbi:Sortase family protein [compost metagenome]